MGKNLTASLVLCVLLSQGLALALALVMMLVFHINPLGHVINLIVSPGALILGLIGGSGAILGCNMSRMPAHGKVMLLTGALGLLLVPLYYYGLYLYALMRFGAILPSLSYGDFLALAFRHSHLNMLGHPSGGPMGGAGYGFLIEHIVWATIGSLVAPLAVDKLPYCKPCRRFHQKGAKRYLRFSDEHVLLAMMEQASRDPAERAVYLMAIRDESASRVSKGTVRLKALQSYCQHCGEHALAETVQVFNGKSFRTVTTLLSTWQPPRQRPAPLAKPPVAAPAYVGF
ncbi:hypothetical protein, partial [Novosphingobium rosa]|uniref:hypothetical protein n=1 Tax=Novosphingobium rosa TaxID=76978 RepID=UPI000A9D8B99